MEDLIVYEVYYGMVSNFFGYKFLQEEAQIRRRGASLGVSLIAGLEYGMDNERTQLQFTRVTGAAQSRSSYLV